MRKSRPFTIGLAALATACASFPDPGPTELAGSSWRLSSFNSRPSPSLMTFNFESAGRISGMIECNSFGGGYVVQPGRIVLQDVTRTLLGCDYSPPPDMNLRKSLRAVLTGPHIRYSVRAGQLIVTEGSNRLVFSRA